jgi:uncharacterized membrane protein YoaK (UPF0700 family)
MTGQSYRAWATSFRRSSASLPGWLIPSAFFTLGNIFTAHITGNLVLASATAARGRHWRFRSSSLLWRLLGPSPTSRTSTARPVLDVQFVLLAAVLIFSVLTRPSTNPHGLMAAVAAMMAVSTMAYQYALLRLALPKVVSTLVMTGNLTNAVLSLMEMLLTRGSFEAADFGTEKLVAFIVGSLVGCPSGCRRLLSVRLDLTIAERPGGARACGAIVDPSALLQAYHAQTAQSIWATKVKTVF